MAILIRDATVDDLSLLAGMNDRLVKDQGSENPYSLSELSERFREWIGSGDWKVDLFEQPTRTIGYAVYQERSDYYITEQQVVYLRQFYIEREDRGKGLGSAIFRRLREERFPPGMEVSLDVVATNEGGDRFWRRLEFTPYFTEMKLQPNHPEAGTDT